MNSARAPVRVARAADGRAGRAVWPVLAGHRCFFLDVLRFWITTTAADQQRYKAKTQGGGKGVFHAATVSDGLPGAKPFVGGSEGAVHGGSWPRNFFNQLFA